MKTIKGVFEEYAQAIGTSNSNNPTWLLERAQELLNLWPELKSELIKYEMLYKAEIEKLISEGSKISQAELKVESSSENYKIFKYLEARDEVLKEQVNMAKKRADIERA